MSTMSFLEVPNFIDFGLEYDALGCSLGFILVKEEDPLTSTHQKFND